MNCRGNDPKRIDYSKLSSKAENFILVISLMHFDSTMISRYTNITHRLITQVSVLSNWTSKLWFGFRIKFINLKLCNFGWASCRAYRVWEEVQQWQGQPPNLWYLISNTLHISSKFLFLSSKLLWTLSNIKGTSTYNMCINKNQHFLSSLRLAELLGIQMSSW